MIYVRIFSGKKGGQEMYEESVQEYARVGELTSIPEFSYDGRKPKLSFGYVSVTHGGEYSAIAYSTSEVGIDIEPIRRMNTDKLRDIGLRTVSENEFFKDWAFREARYKAFGIPVSNPSSGEARFFDFLDGHAFCVIGEGEVLFSYAF